MNDLLGYHGRYLLIDLSAGESRSVPLPPEVLRKFLGGSGLGTYLLLQRGSPEIDPLSPAAPIAFVFSPLVGTSLTTSAKFAVVSKSPLTDRINDSLSSSGFAIAGKRCGCDAIVIVGAAAEPSVVVIDDGDVTIESAAAWWGLDCDAAAKALEESLGAGFQVATIGPAGENLVRYASLSHDGRHAGRGGSGAVFGSKRLKGIAVRGTQRVAVADADGLHQYAKELSRRSFGAATAKYRELGTASNLLTFNRLHALPTRNFQTGSFSEAVAIAPETISLARKKTRASCAACTIGCEHLYALDPTEGKGGKGGEGSGERSSKGVRLEYENLFALGPLCGISDPRTVLKASQRCDQLGIDTIAPEAPLHLPWNARNEG